MPNSVKIASVFVGTVIGAGFASGQEVVQFFLRHGTISVFGVLLSGLLFCLLCCVVLCKIERIGATTLEEYFANWNSPVLIRVLHVMIMLFMLASFCVMVAASGALFDEHLRLPPWLGVILMCAICLTCFWKGTEGVIKINVILTPMMVVGIFVLGLYLTFTSVVAPAFAAVEMWDHFVVSSLLYVSYNTLTLVAVMTALHSLVDSKRTAVSASLMGGGVLCAIALVLWGILYYSPIQQSQIPILSAAGAVSELAKTLYLPVLYFAIVTTAVANGFGVIHYVGKRRKETAVVMCVLAAFVSLAQFSQLVGKVYAFFGYVGFVVLFLTMADGWEELKTFEKWRKTKQGIGRRR